MKRLHTYEQHFLRSPRLVAELIGHTSIKPADTVYDIGAGSGTVASVLARRCKQVVAIELEPQTAAKLRTNMQPFSNVTVVEADFLTHPLPTEPYKVFANIPFSQSSAIVRKLTEAANPPDGTWLIVQKQFANKLLPDFKGFTSQLGILIGPEFAVRIRKPLRRTDFAPPPNVDTVLLEIKRRPTPLLPAKTLPAFKTFVIDCFTQPAIMAKALKKLPAVGAGTKASSLTLQQWLALFAATH